MQNAGIQPSEWSKYLNRGCAVVAIAAGTMAGGTTLQQYKEILGTHGIQEEHLHRIMQNTITTDAMRTGTLHKMIYSLRQVDTTPCDKWYGILASRSCSIALLDDTLRT